MLMRTGMIHGTGADINVEIGFVPEYVRILNLTDGEEVVEAFLDLVIPFTSGSGIKLRAGVWLKMLSTSTTIATIRVKKVILESGTLAGGDAAGWIIATPGDIVGTITAGETAQVYESDPADAAAGTDHITLTTAEVTLGQVTITNAGPVQHAVATTGVAAYVGDADNGYRKGFTVSDGIAEDGKLLGYVALSNGQGEELVAGVTQNEATVW